MRCCLEADLLNLSAHKHTDCLLVFVAACGRPQPHFQRNKPPQPQCVARSPRPPCRLTENVCQHGGVCRWEEGRCVKNTSEGGIPACCRASRLGVDSHGAGTGAPGGHLRLPRGVMNSGKGADAGSVSGRKRPRVAVRGAVEPRTHRQHRVLVLHFPTCCVCSLCGFHCFLYSPAELPFPE